MRTPEASAIWAQGFEAGLKQGVQLGADSVNQALARQRESMGADPWHGSDLALTASGPAWLPPEPGGNGRKHAP